MPYTVTFIQKPMYLHAIVTGVNSKENVIGYLNDIRRECIDRGCARLLIEERLEGPRLGTTAVFQIAVDGTTRAQGLFQAIAYVDVNAEGDLMKFAEVVADNRALRIAVFSSVSDAEKWLLEEGGAGRIDASAPKD